MCPNVSSSIIYNSQDVEADLKHPSTDEWIKMCLKKKKSVHTHTHTQKYYAATEKKILSFATMWKLGGHYAK